MFKYVKKGPIQFINKVFFIYILEEGLFVQPLRSTFQHFEDFDFGTEPLSGRSFSYDSALQRFQDAFEAHRASFGPMGLA